MDIANRISIQCMCHTAHSCKQTSTSKTMLLLQSLAALQPSIINLQKQHTISSLDHSWREGVKKRGAKKPPSMGLNQSTPEFLRRKEKCVLRIQGSCAYLSKRFLNKRKFPPCVCTTTLRFLSAMISNCLGLSLIGKVMENDCALICVVVFLIQGGLLSFTYYAHSPTRCVTCYLSDTCTKTVATTTVIVVANQ